MVLPVLLQWRHAAPTAHVAQAMPVSSAYHGAAVLRAARQHLLLH